MTNDKAAEWVAVADLIPWAANPRDNDGAVQSVVDSIERFGFGAPLLARKENGEIIAGHTRIRAAMQMGLERVPVRYLDISETEAHALALADNKLAEIAEWSDGLADVLAELGDSVEGLGWSSEDLEELLGEVTPPEEGDEPPPEEPEGEPDSVVGEVYQLGPHRLICGDSTGVGVIDQVCPGLADSVWTDPPYGLKYHTIRAAVALDVPKDDAVGDVRPAMAKLKPDGDAYVATDWRAYPEIVAMLGRPKAVVVWDKTEGHDKPGVPNAFTLWGFCHEWVAFYGKNGGRPYSSADVIHIPRASATAAGHATPKPVDLITRCLMVSGVRGLVLDPFAGSGSTMIACAKMGLDCAMVEISPKYCDVIRRRWGAFAAKNGLEPGDGAL